MFIFLYNTGIFLYRIAIQVNALFNDKAKKWIIGRKDIFKKLSQEKFNEAIWFHFASLGEFEQGLPLLDIIRQKYSQADFLLTFFSPSGYEYAKKKYPEWTIYYLPIDTHQHAEHFLKIVKPKAAFFIKYEFWYHYLTQLKKSNTPTFLVSGIFRKNQAFFSWYGKFYQKMLLNFSYLFVQNEESKELLLSVGIHQVEVFGDTRMDRVLQIKQQAFDDIVIQQFMGKSKVFVAGSIWPSDLPILEQIMNLLPADWKMIIAPHEISSSNHFPFKLQVELYSRFQHSNARILIIDTMGILSKLYRVGKIAYIGGGYGKGIHNILEAIIYEIPIFIGPKFQKFQEAKELISSGVAFDTADQSAMNILKQLISNDDYYFSLKKKANDYISKHTNVSENIAVFISSKALI